MHIVYCAAGKKHSVLDGDSDDDDLPNTYDRNDSFIDDEDISEGKIACTLTYYTCIAHACCPACACVQQG